MEYPQFDRFRFKDTPIHRWDPRLKVVATFFLAFSIVLVSNVKLAFLGFCIVMVALALSRLPLRFIMSYLKWLFFFMLFFFIVMPFTYGGEEILFGLGPFNATYEGFERTIFIVLRAFSVAILMFILLATTGFENLIKALEKLKFPNKLLQILMLSYRYIFVFISEAQRTWRGLYSRGFQMGKLPRMHTFETIGKAIGMLFIRSYERSERVYQAMVSRGYAGSIKTIEEFKVGKTDIIWTCGMVILAIFLQILNLVI